MTSAKHEAWRAAYDLTELEADILCALVTARTLGAPLGCDPVTRRQLRYVGFAEAELRPLSGLERRGLVEKVAITEEEHPQWWIRASDLAFRRFGLVPPTSTCRGFSPSEYAEEMLRRADARARRKRMKESA